MALAQFNQADYQLLPDGPRNLIISFVEQGMGPWNPEANGRVPYAHAVFTDMETGKRLDGIYTLGLGDYDKGVFAIIELFDAVNSCPSNQRVELTQHDFELREHNQMLEGSVVIGDIWAQKFEGRWRNKVGAITPARPIPGWDVIDTSVEAPEAVEVAS